MSKKRNKAVAEAAGSLFFFAVIAVLLLAPLAYLYFIFRKGPSLSIDMADYALSEDEVDELKNEMYLLEKFDMIHNKNLKNIDINADGSFSRRSKAGKQANMIKEELENKRIIVKRLIDKPKNRLKAAINYKKLKESSLISILFLLAHFIYKSFYGGFNINNLVYSSGVSILIFISTIILLSVFYFLKTFDIRKKFAYGLDD